MKCKITNLTIDKLINNIAYNNLEHKYWNIDTGEIYTSVTTFLKQFSTPFDSELISIYKAFEAYCTIDLYELKYAKYNMKQIVQILKNSYYKYPEFKNKIEVYAQNLRNTWKQSGVEASNKGTIEHSKREQYIYNNKSIELYNIKDNSNILYNYSNKDIFNLLNDKNKVYDNIKECFPEQLVYSHKYKLAGQIDLLCFYNKDINIYDYKTNKIITTSNKYQTLMPPFNTIENCHLNTYSMQLSLYSILIKEMFSYMKDYQVNLSLIHITDKKDKYIKCIDYSKELINFLDFIKNKK